MSETAGTFKCAGISPPRRACSACGKQVTQTLTFDLSILMSQVPREVQASLGPYEPGEYHFCYECVLKKLGAKPKGDKHQIQEGDEVWFGDRTGTVASPGSIPLDIAATAIDDYIVVKLDPAAK